MVANILEAVLDMKRSGDGFYPKVLLAGSSEQYGHVLDNELPIVEAQPFRPRSPYAVSLTDGIQRLLENGEPVRAVKLPARSWLDSGTLRGLLQTNAYFTRKQNAVAANATIVEPTLGEHVSVGGGCTVRRASLRDCILLEGAVVESVEIEHCVIGAGARVMGKPGAEPLRDRIVGDGEIIELG